MGQAGKGSDPSKDGMAFLGAESARNLSPVKRKTHKGRRGHRGKKMVNVDPEKLVKYLNANYA